MGLKEKPSGSLVTRTLATFARIRGEKKPDSEEPPGSYTFGTDRSIGKTKETVLAAITGARVDWHEKAANDPAYQMFLEEQAQGSYNEDADAARQLPSSTADVPRAPNHLAAARMRRRSATSYTIQIPGMPAAAPSAWSSSHDPTSGRYDVSQPQSRHNTDLGLEHNGADAAAMPQSPGWRVVQEAQGQQLVKSLCSSPAASAGVGPDGQMWITEEEVMDEGGDDGHAAVHMVSPSQLLQSRPGSTKVLPRSSATGSALSPSSRPGSGIICPGGPSRRMEAMLPALQQQHQSGSPHNGSPAGSGTHARQLSSALPGSTTPSGRFRRASTSLEQPGTHPAMTAIQEAYTSCPPNDSDAAHSQPRLSKAPTPSNLQHGAGRTSSRRGSLLSNAGRDASGDASLPGACVLPPIVSPTSISGAANSSSNAHSAHGLTPGQQQLMAGRYHLSLRMRDSASPTPDDDGEDSRSPGSSSTPAHQTARAGSEARAYEQYLQGATTPGPGPAPVVAGARRRMSLLMRDALPATEAAMLEALDETREDLERSRTRTTAAVRAGMAGRRSSIEMLETLAAPAAELKTWRLTYSTQS